MDTTRRTVIFDLDGTAVTTDASYLDVVQTDSGPDFSLWSAKAALTMRPRRAVQLVWLLARLLGFRILVVTARSETVADVTIDWLEHHGMVADQWHFRPDGWTDGVEAWKERCTRGQRCWLALDDDARNVAAFRRGGALAAVKVRRAG